MRSRLSLASSLVFLLGLTQAVAVHAAPLVASSTASITGLSYRLVDLDLTDGITPWIQFNPNNYVNMWAGTLAYSDGTPIEVLEFSALDASALGNYSTSLSSSDGAAASVIAPGTQTASVQVDSALVASNAVLNSYGEGWTESSTEFRYLTGSFYAAGSQDEVTGQITGFTVSANTAVLFEGNYAFETTADLTVVQDGIYSAAEGWSNVVVTGSNESMLTLQLSSVDEPEGEFFQDFDAQTFLLGYQEPENTLFSASKSGGFSLSFENFSSMDVQAVFTAEVQTKLDAGVYAVPAIPEPSTYAMMGLGLGLLGWRVRKAGVLK